MKNLELVVYGSLRRRLAPRLLHLETIATLSGFFYCLTCFILFGIQCLCMSAFDRDTLK